MNSVKAGLSASVNAELRARPQEVVKGVLFDKDGTLIDFQRTWGPAIHSVIHALAKGDAEKVRAQAECLHFDVETRRFSATSPILGGSTEQYGMNWAAALGRDDFVVLRAEIDALAAVACVESFTPVGDPVDVMRALRAMGMKIGLATNDAEASARRHLKQLKLTEWMDFIAGYDSGHGSKPAPGMVDAFAREIGAKPSEIALVGDTLHDLGCAKAAGALAVAVLSGIASREELAPYADCVIADIGELPGLLTRRSA